LLLIIGAAGLLLGVLPIAALIIFAVGLATRTRLSMSYKSSVG